MDGFCEAHQREAIILAGGRGTRLSSVVHDVPKPLANVAGRPFIRFVLDRLQEQGFGRIVLAVGYGRDQIAKYLGTAYRGMELVYSVEEEPLLTGGAVKRALSHCESSWVCVLNGDTFLEMDFATLYQVAYGAGRDTQGVIAIKYLNDTSRYGTLEMTLSGEVKGFREKRSQVEGFINAGVYLLRRDALDDMPVRFSLERDFFEANVDGGCLRAVECVGAFIDIGVPEDYRRAQVVMRPYVRRWKLAFFDRDGTINEDVGHLFEPDRLVLIEKTVELIRRFSANPDCKVVVITNQAGIAKGLYDKAEMHRLHREMDRQLAERGARIDAYYYCPHHPDFTGPCTCRKPLPGLIEKALFDFDADPSNCLMFGDKNTDAQAAHAAGVAFEFIGQDACHPTRATTRGELTR